MARPRASQPNPAQGLAFLLSQVGSHSAAKFEERLEPLGLKPPHAGILRAIRQGEGISQQSLGERLGVFPSRLVAIIDGLEKRGLVERRHSPVDRRSYALYLTDAGREALEQVGAVACHHQDSIFAALSDVERKQLAELLQRVADEQGLTPGVHPGFRKMGKEDT